VTSRQEQNRPGIGYTLWLFNIAVVDGPFVDDKTDDLPIENGDFP